MKILSLALALIIAPALNAYARGPYYTLPRPHRVMPQSHERCDTCLSPFVKFTVGATFVVVGVAIIYSLTQPQDDKGYSQWLKNEKKSPHRKY